MQLWVLAIYTSMFAHARTMNCSLQGPRLAVALTPTMSDGEVPLCNDICSSIQLDLHDERSCPAERDCVE